MSYLVGCFSRIQTLRVHDAQIQSGIWAQQEVGPLPQLHRAPVVLVVLLVVPGQRVDGGNKTLQQERKEQQDS